jgi:HK97 family phage major capsid protein
MLNDHDNAQAIGRGVSLVSTDLGLEVKFRIARGAEGDKALALAADGVRDGLSVGIDFTDDGFEMDGDVYSVRQAALREVTLTAMPAYDDARVTSVAASQDGKDTGMHCTTCGQIHAPGVVECASATAPAGLNLDSISQAITNGFANLPQREIVPATGSGIAVREEAPYRIDRRGNVASGGKFEFSTDVINGAKGDKDAETRALSFMAEHLGFDVDTTDGAALTPNRNRPDLYVDQREYRTPLWDRVNRGTLADNTPFVLPKFSSSSGLVANHTEGVEPTAGAFAATSQTITPLAVSGKVEITRELWDRGGNPQVSSIIWRQMTRAYMEALEAYVVTVLDAASPTGITLTTAAADDALADLLQAAFVDLQYVRGGFAFDTFVTQIDLYKKLALAEDSTGRPLFPMLGPTNTNGQARPLWGSLDVGGIEAIPSWALAATGVVAASSYLFDRYAVNFWASAPQRLEFQYRVAYVDLAIWGYKAGAITDLTGVREVIYDPA